MTLIDIIGLPASGKTTLSSTLLEGLRRRKCPVLGREEAADACLRRRDVGVMKAVLKLLPRAVRDPLIGRQHALGEWHAFAVEHVPLMNLVYEVLSRRGVSRAFRECILYAFMQQGILHELFRRHLTGNEAVLWDEGFLHRGFTLFGYLDPETVDEEDLRRYVQHAPKPAAAVWVDTPQEAICRRLEERVERKSGLPVLLVPCPEERRAAQLEHGASCLARIAQMAEAAGVMVLRLGPGTDGQENHAYALAEDLVPVLAEFMSRGGNRCMS